MFPTFYWALAFITVLGDRTEFSNPETIWSKPQPYFVLTISLFIFHYTILSPQTCSPTKIVYTFFINRCLVHVSRISPLTWFFQSSREEKQIGNSAVCTFLLYLLFSEDEIFTTLFRKESLFSVFSMRCPISTLNTCQNWWWCYRIGNSVWAYSMSCTAPVLSDCPSSFNTRF